MRLETVFDAIDRTDARARRGGLAGAELAAYLLALDDVRTAIAYQAIPTPERRRLRAAGVAPAEALRQLGGRVNTANGHREK